MRLTEAQRKLLRRAAASQNPDGAPFKGYSGRLRTARILAQAGLADLLVVGGGHLPRIRLTPAGRAILGAREMKLNANESKVLAFLADSYDSDGTHYSFRAISQHVSLNIKEIRRACRSLKKKGLATFASGLWTEDGEPAGSGYGATKAGTEALLQKEEGK